MHLVTKSYFDSFCQEFGFTLGDSRSFEAFANFCIASQFADDEINPEELVYEGADPGIDGAVLFVDGRVFFTADDLKDFLGSGKREHDFHFIFTQVKSSETWIKKEIESFHAAVVDFLSDAPVQPQADFLIEFKKLFETVFANIKRVRGGLPDVSCFFITAGPTTNAVEIQAARTIAQSAIERTGYFREVEFSLIGRERIHEMWQAAGSTDEATIPVSSFSAFPAAPGVTSAYIAPISAREFINKVLKNPDGSRRKKLFEKNVRDFLGENAEVNEEISQTLQDGNRRMRFGLMNNGVTIVAETVRPAGQSIFFSNYQIVNGCQTSNVLLQNESFVDETVSLMVKIIESDDLATIDDIVRATNRQSTVEDEQFASALRFLADLEAYFNARGSGQPNRIVFERRKGQYRGDGIPQARIVDVKEVAKAIAATSMQRPDLASRFVGRLTGDMREQVLNPSHGEELFYVSSFSHYRLRILISNKRIDPKYSKLRWHILFSAWLVCLSNFSRVGEKNAEGALEKLFTANDGVWFERLQSIIAACIPDPGVSRDVLKGQPFTLLLRERAAKVGWQ